MILLCILNLNALLQAVQSVMLINVHIVFSINTVYPPAAYLEATCNCPDLASMYYANEDTHNSQSAPL